MVRAARERAELAAVPAILRWAAASPASLRELWAMGLPIGKEFYEDEAGRKPVLRWIKEERTPQCRGHVGGSGIGMDTMRKGSDFDDLLAGIRREAEAEGPRAISELQAVEWKYRALNQLIERRRELNLTQKELAERAGVSQADVSKIERGRKSPTLDTYSRLAAALQIKWQFGASVRGGTRSKRKAAS
jgi:DNA-binding XRE family transcriptional regulator